MTFKEVVKTTANSLAVLIDYTIYFLQRARIAQVICMAFMLYITWDFHTFYKENFKDFTGWQMTALMSYGMVFVTTIRFMFDHLDIVISRRNMGGNEDGS